MSLNALGEERIELNVGGVIFHTTRLTLCSVDPGVRRGRFMTLLPSTQQQESPSSPSCDDSETENKAVEEKPSENQIIVEQETPSDDHQHFFQKLLHSHKNYFFIDRDPTHFRFVLNYLRNQGQVVLPVKDDVMMEELLVEAEYYQLKGLMALIRNERRRCVYEYLTIDVNNNYTEFFCLGSEQVYKQMKQEGLMIKLNALEQRRAKKFTGKWEIEWTQTKTLCDILSCIGYELVSSITEHRKKDKYENKLIFRKHKLFE